MKKTPETNALLKQCKIKGRNPDPWKLCRKLERKREEIAALVRRLFELLETVEVSDSEREFHPTTISSCRVMHIIELEKLLPKLKEAAQ